jgi:beta-lactamase superfamily II metal-dependent hydrolase
MPHVPSFLRMRPARPGRGHVCKAVLALALLSSTWAWSSRVLQKALRIFFVDVEGGQATLFVTPQQHALLIDTGWPGNKGRMPIALLP